MIYSYDLRRIPLQSMTATLSTNYEEPIAWLLFVLWRRCIQFQDMLSTYWRRGESMEAALISSQSLFTFYNYIKFDVWKSFVFGYMEWTRRQATVKYKVSSGQQFRMNRKKSWLAIIQISLDCHDSTSNALFLCPEYRLHFTSPHIFLTNPSLSLSIDRSISISLSISHTRAHTHTHTHSHRYSFNNKSGSYISTKVIVGSLFKFIPQWGVCQRHL